MCYHDIIEPEGEDPELDRVDGEPALLCSADYDDEHPVWDQLDPEPGLLCSSDCDDEHPVWDQLDPEPGLLCSSDCDDESVNSTSGKTSPSYFVFSRLPTSPLDWRLTLVYSYLCSRTRFNRGASLRDIQGATGISRTTLTTLKNDAGVEQPGLMRKLIDAGLVKLIDKQYFALEPPEDVANGLFYHRSGEVKHWTDRWAYFPFTKSPEWSTPVALVYCKLVSMKTNSLTERGLAKLLGIGRDAVGNALEKLISLHKIVVHPVPDEACSFFLIVRDYSLDDDPEAPKPEEDKEEAPVQVEDVTKSEKPKLSRYDEFVQFCRNTYKFPDHVIHQLYEFEKKLGHKRFNEILVSSFEEHERKKKADPDKYYGSCHALLVHRLGREISHEQ
jgi:hypothetical protein